ncbi:MAG: SAM-dependent methyltransferase [Desulfurococcaceae archaeon]|uniref:Uncharacterized protein n=1 Tax=Staphylothermus marinus TaxID=2280 RepID=A0A7C4HCU0_STAMA
MERGKPIVIIEHLEEYISIWLFLEYRSSSLIYGKEYLWFTNIPFKYNRLLSKYGRVFNKSIIELINDQFIKSNEVIILDPSSSKNLEYGDLIKYKYVVIGGIMGDHPPRGRTKKLISDKLPVVETRKIGDKQYSIDGSVYYVNYMWNHRDMSSYRYVDGVELTGESGSIYLPYRYPLEEGKPRITPGLVDYLLYGKLHDSIRREIFEENVE